MPAPSACFFRPLERDVSLRDALLARWAGESVNSLMPAGQIGGPMMMVRYLTQRGMRARDAAAAITVSTTVQTIAQMIFALARRGAARRLRHERAHERRADRHRRDRRDDLRVLSGAAARPVRARDAFCIGCRRALFGKRDWSSLVTRAEAVDTAVHEMYRERGKVAASFALSMVGWIVGTGEVWLALRLLGHPVDWTDALMLESLGQAIRGAAFAIPGSLGVQEGGYPAAGAARRPAAGSGARAVAREARARTVARRAGHHLSAFR